MAAMAADPNGFEDGGFDYEDGDGGADQNAF